MTQSDGLEEKGKFTTSQIGELKQLSSSMPTGSSKRCLVTVIRSGQVYEIVNKTGFTIGRISASQMILPDIDLSDQDAYGQGVSRLHAQIKITNDHLYIMDLGSSNGTRVNGQKISPHIEYPIENDDIVALGKLQLQIITSR
ncbi:MAG: FHA domain-containing protein [Anaerolineae bacterium]|nr:FHA domain-containing protein [Anaerolineae bacterium]